MSYTVVSTSTFNGPAFMFALVVGLAIGAVVIVSFWKIFQKAGKPGWASIVPVYNSWVLFEIGGKPGWYSLIGLLGGIPFLGVIAIIAYLVLYVMAILEVAKRFGKSVLFAIFGLIIFPIVGYPMLAFGKATYNSGAAAPSGTLPPSPTPTPPTTPPAQPPASTPPVQAPPAPPKIQ